MKKLILVLLLSFALASNIYVLEFTKDLDCGRAYVVEGELEKILEPENGFTATIVGDEDLYSQRFFVPKVSQYDNFESGGGMVEREAQDLTIILPYYDSGERIDITDEEGLLVCSFDVSRFVSLKQKRSVRFKPEQGLPLIPIAIVVLVIIAAGGFVFLKQKKKPEKPPASWESELYSK